MRLLIYLRSLLATLVFLFLTVSMGLLAIFILFLSGRRQRWADPIIRAWANGSLWAYGVRVIVHGKENISKTGCLYLFNHSSHFDILALCVGGIAQARFGAKIELYSIPIFGNVLKAVGTLPIARGEREKVLELYKQSVPLVHQGAQFTLAAEGTRQPTPGVGDKFKHGPFIFAMAGQFPIVPAVIRGAAECLPKGHLIACTKSWIHNIHVHFLPAISTKGLLEKDRNQLQDLVRQQMVKAYADLVDKE